MQNRTASILLAIIISFNLQSCNLQNSNTPQTETEINFANDIAPIIFKNCTVCHNPNGAGPFNLLSYADVFKRKQLIVAVTKSGFMPPWPADTIYSHFAGEKKLNKNERALIERWVKLGAKSGDTSNEKNYFEQKISNFSKPDLVLTMPESLLIKGDARDLFLLMKIPYQLETEKIVKKIEFVPGQKKLVHHVNGQLLMYDFYKRKNVNSGAKSVSIDEYPTVLSAYQKMQLAHDDGTYPTMKQSVVNYLPGVEGVEYPQGIGGFIMPKKGAFFFKDIHYGPATRDVYDVSKLNIWFGTEPTKRPTFEMQLGTLGISIIEPPLIIPPNEIKTFKTQITITADMSVLTVNPHMHLLGKKFWAYAITPTGDTIKMIKINKWDFRWQYFYTYKNIMHLPAGTTIYAFGVYDNTINNTLNPNHPPKIVAERDGSMRTTDEMFQFIITYLPYQKGDENISLEK